MEINLIEQHNFIDFKHLQTNDLIKVDDGEEKFWAIVHKKLRRIIKQKTLS